MEKAAVSFLESMHPSAQSQSAVNAPLLENSVLTLDLNTHPHLTRVVPYSRPADLRAFGGVTSFFSVIAFAPLGQQRDHGFISACFSVCVKQACFKTHMHFPLFLQD